MAAINGVVADIASGAREQATGLEQVNIAINQMDQVTQKNAAMVEESTAANHSLTEEINQLFGLVRLFQVGQAGGDDPLRRQLQEAAPHAFASPAKTPIAPIAKPRLMASQAQEKTPRTARSTPKATANGAPASGEAADWVEF